MNKPISQVEYKKDERCPMCEGNVVEGGPIDINSGEATQNVFCTTCCATWTDIYRLQQYDNLRDGDDKDVDVPEVETDDEG